MANKVDRIFGGTGKMPGLVNNRVDDLVVRDVKKRQVPEVEGSEIDTVNLTDAARRLQHLNQIIQQSPGIDLKRIEHIRQMLADGTYQVDAEGIADGLLKMERMLNGDD